MVQACPYIHAYTENLFIFKCPSDFSLLSFHVEYKGKALYFIGLLFYHQVITQFIFFREMKILHVIPTLLKGGAERLVSDICIELAKRKGVEVKVAILHNVSQYKFLSNKLDIEICPSEVTLSIFKRTKANLEPLNRLIRSFQPDILHSHLYEAEVVTREQVFENIKYISHLHGKMKILKKSSVKDCLSKQGLIRLYERRRMMEKYKSCNNSFIAISNDVKNFFEREIGIGKFNIKVLHNAIDLKRFSLSGDKSKPEGKLKLVSVGSLVPRKAQDFLIDVAHILKNKGVGFELNILGEGELRASLERKIMDLSLKNEVVLRGMVDHPESFLKNAHIYVHSATNEPFGLVLIEAMAAGLPVVSTFGGGNRDIIIDGKNGFMIYQRDPELFAEKLIDLSHNEIRYCQMSNDAREFSKGFSIREYVDKLLEFYNHF